MRLPRIDLFEFNDAAWAPPLVRETIVESLSRTLAWGRILRGLVAPFEAFVAAAGATEILDLASGAGGPALILAREILGAGGTPPRFILTDLHPRRDAWERACAELPGVLSYEPDPVDATRIHPGIAAAPSLWGAPPRPRARVIINAFHHLPPPIACGVLEDAVRAGAPIFVAEGFGRNPLGFAPFLLPGLLAIAATPFCAPRDRVAKTLLAWSPLMPALSVWDGISSTLRIHDRPDVEAMVGTLGGGFAWTHGTFTFPLGGRGTFFYGVPAPLAAPAA